MWFLRRIRYAHRPSQRRPPLRRGQRVFIKLLFILFVFLTALSITLIRARPIIIEVAKAEAHDSVLEIMNDAISGEVNSGEMDYNKLVALQKDNKGNITALVTNMALINTLQAKISNTVIDNVAGLFDTRLSVPVGNIFGGILFSGRGPGIPVKIQSITQVTSEFSNSFTDAGVNQTRHKIMLTVSAQIGLLVPGCSATEEVSTQVAVAETVIVGAVPNIFANAGN